LKRILKICALAVVAVAALITSGMFGASYYYTTQHGAGCAGCHEMANYTSAVHSSAHQNATTCLDCHDASMATKLRHIAIHLSGRIPEAIRLRDVDVVAMTANCQKCHQKEYATWHAGPHSATYQQIFADPKHNSKRRLMDDCFRCHGMHYSGPVRELVQPQNITGPWHLVRAGFADQPTMPCQSCHWVHREGQPETKPATRISVASPAMDDSLAFFDRREQMHFSAASLALPQLYEGARPVHASPDRRQALCYQCHASRMPEPSTIADTNHWGPQVGSGDDRTPLGVHEGLSCFSCHTGHNENARASCVTCHPQMSHCGLDVEKMDTTYANPASKHNVHWVKCVDCHTHGVPKPKVSQTAALAAGQ